MIGTGSLRRSPPLAVVQDTSKWPPGLRMGETMDNVRHDTSVACKRAGAALFQEPVSVGFIF